MEKVKVLEIIKHWAKNNNKRKGRKQASLFVM